jgi:ATP-dependent helicase/nuclease subunit A
LSQGIRLDSRGLCSFDATSVMPALRHTLISASAGSGKTYQLVQRYLQLLALGVPPDRIAAMTFTRKAAGEFVNRILLRLALLADDAQAAAAFGESLGIKPGQGTDFAAVLRQVLNDLPRLRLLLLAQGSGSGPCSLSL